MKIGKRSIAQASWSLRQLVLAYPVWAQKVPAYWALIIFQSFTKDKEITRINKHLLKIARRTAKEKQVCFLNRTAELRRSNLKLSPQKNLGFKSLQTLFLHRFTAKNKLTFCSLESADYQLAQQQIL